MRSRRPFISSTREKEFNVFQAATAECFYLFSSKIKIIVRRLYIYIYIHRIYSFSSTSSSSSSGLCLINDYQETCASIYIYIYSTVHTESLSRPRIRPLTCRTPSPRRFQPIKQPLGSRRRRGRSSSFEEETIPMKLLSGARLIRRLIDFTCCCCSCSSYFYWLI